MLSVKLIRYSTAKEFFKKSNLKSMGTTYSLYLDVFMIWILNFLKFKK